MAFAAGARVGPYEILAPLGAGGMGEVYKARDTRLQRIIALKTLPLEQGADQERKRRFLIEAQAASRLNHPNIVTIYDILEENGVCFIAMEFIAGITLERATGLPLDQALKYAAEIADALAAAHSAGIIHRDLKPANIIVTEDGRVKLLDFGVAKLVEPAAGAGEGKTATAETVPGVILGTAAYMSPEQALGRELDARSDIFSFGVVLYEMLSGRRAFRGDSLVSTLSSILHDEPQSLRDINQAIPSYVDQCVTRCLCKDPSQRFQTMDDVKRALAERVAIHRQSASIAVLPFVNLSADKENEYFGDGLAEEIINALTKVPELRVIARTSAFALRGSQQTLRAIGERLSVGTVLEGSVRRAGNRIRVTAQLIQVADESHLWSDRYDREMTDIFAIQDDISQAIASALKVKLAPPRHQTVNLEAFQCYLKGLYWYQRYTPESLAKAKESFEQALAHDPNYAPAYTGLAVFYYGIGALGIQRMTEMAPLAKAAGERALAIDNTLSEAHSVLGLITGPFEYDWKRAGRHFEAAMSVDPVPPLVRVRYALYFLIPWRRFQEAVAQFHRALETDPLSMMVHFGLAFALYCERKFDAAIEHAARAVELFPDHWLEHFAMGFALSQKGCLEQAIASLEETLRLSPTFGLGAAFLAAAHARSGNRSRAEEVMCQMREMSHKHYISPVCFAVYHAALGESDTMFEYLEAALLEREPYLTRMDAEPYFDPYHPDSRYRELLQRMNLLIP